MASPRQLTVFLLISLFISLHTGHARESQFFSKVTKETQQVPTKEQQQTTTVTNEELQKQKEVKPTFVPQTAGDSYGLYGHETGQLPPGAETVRNGNGTPYKTTVSEESLYRNNYNNMNYEQNNNYYNNKQFGNTDRGLPYKSTVTEESLYSNNYDQQNNNNYEQYNKNNNYNYNNEKYTYNKDSYVTDEERARSGSGYTANSFYSGGNGDNNVKQEGMSDTRFMENGKYFYDVNNEEKYLPSYRYDSSRMASRTTSYNPNGNGQYYAGNSEYYGNRNAVGASYGQNQEEFQEVQDELEP